MKSCLAVAGLSLLTFVAAQNSIVGTWTTKSRQVFTGPGFYNPVEDKLIEPELPGISYSFTSDGYYEEAYFRAVSNPGRPECVSGVMQWQHGTYSLESNGSIVLNPFESDGRQLTSTPCQYDSSLYVRYYQPGLMSHYRVEIDDYHNIPRLTLFQWDGAPMQPMYLQYSPPQMLPTQTLNPTATPSATMKAQKRGEQTVLKSEVVQTVDKLVPATLLVTPDQVWWSGIALVAIGSAMYMYPSKQ